MRIGLLLHVLFEANNRAKAMASFSPLRQHTRRQARHTPRSNKHKGKQQEHMSLLTLLCCDALVLLAGWRVGDTAGARV